MRRNFFIAVLITLALTSTTHAQTGSALLLKPLLSEDENLESRGDALFQASGRAEDADLNLAIFDLEGRFREQREKYIPRIGWDLTFFNQTSDIPILDQNLLDTSVGIGLEVGQMGDWRAGLSVGIGYAGNAPFGEGDAWYGKATLVVGKQLDEKTDLGFVIDYDGNRSLYPDIPIPGIAYRHEFDPKLNYTVGLPLSSVTWKPSKPISVTATWQFVDSLDARIEYTLSPAWIVFGNVAQRKEAFTVDGIPDHDRLLFQGRSIEAGVRWHPWAHTSFLLAGGYAFNQEYSIGYDQGDSDKLADVSDEPYLHVGFERRW